jgi:hypothetical protein
MMTPTSDQKKFNVLTVKLNVVNFSLHIQSVIVIMTTTTPPILLVRYHFNLLNQIYLFIFYRDYYFFNEKKIIVTFHYSFHLFMKRRSTSPTSI